MRYPGWIGSFNKEQSPTANAEDLVNFYVHKNPPNARSPYSLYPTPGVKTIFTVPNSPGRRLFSESGRMFAVIGTDLYEILQNDTYVKRNGATALAVNGNPATLCTNGDGGAELAISSGGALYILDLLTHVFTHVAGVVADRVDMLNGYFLAFNLAQHEFRISDLLDGLTWDPTQFAQRTIAPDPWQTGCANGYSEYWLLGQYTTEIWRDTGAFPFPFEPREGLLIPHGIGAAFSALSSDAVMVWLEKSPAGSGSIVEASGYTPERISNSALEAELATYPRIDDVETWEYQEHGEDFYIFNFPTADKTWGYNKRLGPELGWHRRTTLDPITGLTHRWQPTWHAHEWNLHYVLDAVTGAVHKLSTAYGTDAGDVPIRRVRQGPTLFNENKLVRVSEFELVIESGLGTSGQGEDPQIILERSEDGGKTWKDGRQRSAGKTGEYGIRPIWNRCGGARQLAFRVIFSDPTPLRIHDALLKAS